MNSKESSPVSELVEVEAEKQIDALRHKAFATNSPEDRTAYFEACSKWFQDRLFRRMASADRLTALEAEVARKDAEIERLRGRLRMAELMMTKDSLCEAERLEEGLHCVRAALSAPKGGEHV